MVESSLRQRLLTTMGARGVAMLLGVAGDLLLVPLYLAAWGVDGYRQWVVVMAAVGLLELLDLGLQNYFANRMMGTWSAGDREGCQRTLAMALFAYLLMIGASACALLLVPDPLLFWLALATVAQLPLGVLFARYRVLGEPARGVWAESLRNGVVLLLSASLLLLEGTPLLLARLLLLVHLLTPLLLTLDQKRRHGVALPRPARGTGWREALVMGFHFSWGDLSVKAMVQGMVLLLAGLSGDERVVLLYTTARTVTGLARQAGLQLAMAAGVEQSREHGAGRSKTLRPLFLFTGRFAAGVSGGLVGFLLILGEEWLRLWTGGLIPHDPALWWAFSLYSLLAVPAQAAGFFPQYTNHPLLLGLSRLGVAVTAFLLGMLLIPGWGALGAVVGLVAGETLFSAGWLTLRVCRMVGVNWRTYISGAYGVGIAACGAGAVGALLVHGMVGEATGYGAFFAKGMVWGILLCGPALYLAWRKLRPVSGISP